MNDCSVGQRAPTAVVMAYHDIGCAGLESLWAAGFDVRAVFTHTDSAHEAQWFGSVAQLSAKRELNVYAPEQINHPLWIERVRQLAPNFLFSFYYRKLLSPEFLDIPCQGAFNLHGSLLPRYRGRCPTNWVLINGESRTGVTLHEMTPRPDDGDIVAQRAVPIEHTDTALDVHRKLVGAARALMDETLKPLVLGKAARIPQVASEASYFGGRCPADGLIDWHQPAKRIYDLVRAISLPYPGAFTHRSDKTLHIWEAALGAPVDAVGKPGQVLGIDPLLVACGTGALEIRFAQAQGGVYTSGPQAALDLGVMPGTVLGADTAGIEGQSVTWARPRQAPKKVLILGINGFIGNALAERLLDEGGYEVHGLDLNDSAVRRLSGRAGFQFHEGDIAIHREWIEYHVKKCDIVLPLVAIATPAEYIRNPLRVFELDFEENLRVVRYCVKYGKRLIFPSTSEVYGMCDDDRFSEERSNLVLGPIHKQRWIYASSKQLLDRVIWAYGESEGLPFTLFRPFNWIGPRLDSLESARIGSSRAITQLILNLVEGTPIELVDGGQQRRCFTDIDDGIEALFQIIENRSGGCNGRIFNIGNPDNELSIEGLARMLIGQFDKHYLRRHFPVGAGCLKVASEQFYGAGYEDVNYRRPCIDAARRVLGWQPKVPLENSVASTLDFFLNDWLHVQDEPVREAVGGDPVAVRVVAGAGS